MSWLTSLGNLGSGISGAFKGFGQDIGLMPRKRRRYTGNPHLDPTPEQVQDLTDGGDLSFNQELAMAMSQGTGQPLQQLKAPRGGKVGRKLKFAPMQPDILETDNRQFSLVQPRGNDLMSGIGRRKRLRHYTGGYV